MMLSLHNSLTTREVAFLGLSSCSAPCFPRYKHGPELDNLYNKFLITPNTDSDLANVRIRVDSNRRTGRS